MDRAGGVDVSWCCVGLLEMDGTWHVPQAATWRVDNSDFLVLLPAGSCGDDMFDMSSRSWVLFIGVGDE